MYLSLPIEKDPSFRELHTSAYPLSILEIYQGFSKKWLIQNFVNIAFKKEYDNVLTYIRPYFWFWNCFEVKYSLHYPFKNVIKKIKAFLSKGYYVFLCVNEKYIPERIYYENTYYNHEILIFGYNDEKFEFDTIGYNDKKKYETQKIAYSNIDKAFRTDYEHFYKFYALKVKPNYNFDKTSTFHMKQSINMYLNTRNAKKGFNAYQYLREYIRSFLENGKQINMRSFRMIKERAAVMVLIPNYFKIDTYLDKLLKDNVRISETLFLLVLKWNRSPNTNIKESILNHINLYMINEKEFFTKFLETL